MQKVQNIPGLAGLCRDVWFMFPKERYQYSEKLNDSQQENNLGAQMSTESQSSDIERGLEDCSQSMDVTDDCDSLPGNSNELLNELDDINDAIFLSTFKEEPEPSSEER